MGKVHVYYTGGTIGMIKDSEGRFVPDPRFPERMRNELRGVPGIPEWDIFSRTPLLDSSNMTPEDWSEIAHYIEDKYDKYESFVILHGTDTMAYTASALAFMISGLRKPIIFTGSQVPLSEPDNDARDNLVFSLMAAGNFQLPKPEVCLFFGKKLLRGCRTVKIDAEGHDAFDSPNFPPLAEAVEKGINFGRQSAMPHDEDDEVELSVQEFTSTKVGLLRLFPGISAEVTRNLLQPPLEGAVLLAYGSGNGPSGEANETFRKVLKEAARRAVIVGCTQCLRGSVDLNRYETGLGQLGVISGYDMTAEAALTKLYWLLSLNLPLRDVRARMQRNLRGELTRDS